MSSLSSLVREELSTPVDPRVAAMAASIAAAYPGSARAVLFYGSCLRETQLDGLMLDFYLIVSDYGDAYPKRWMAIANRLIPPNVFPFQHGGLIAKYAVLSETDFHRLNGPEARNVSVWARFAQVPHGWVPDQPVCLVGRMAQEDAPSPPLRPTARSPPRPTSVTACFQPWRHTPPSANCSPSPTATMPSAC
mgnify:CR=1 FL=1